MKSKNKYASAIFYFSISEVLVIFRIYLLYHMTFATKVRVQLIGYERNIVCGVWNCGIRKMVNSQMIRKRQAPRSEEITGISEWPIPRMEFAMPSIMPQRK